MFDPASINTGSVRYDHTGEHSELGKFTKDFYDRKETKEDIVAHLASPNRTPVIVIGARRSGKTSMLRLVSDLITYFSEGFASVLILHQELQSREQLVERILHNVRSEVTRLDPSARIDFTARRGLTVTSQFIDEMAFLLKQLPGRTMVICIDELDSIVKAAGYDRGGGAGSAQGEDAPARNGGGEVARMLRALTDSALRVKLVVSMFRIDESNEHLSEFCARSQSIYLPTFGREDCREMVGELLSLAFRPSENLPDSALRPSEEELERLYTLSGGWPYFLKLILSHISKSPETDWLDQALQRALRSEGAGLSINEMYKKDLDKCEKVIVLLLAKSKGPVKRSDIEAANRTLQKAEIERALQNLMSRGFITEAGGDYSFKPCFLKKWFRNWHELGEEASVYLPPQPWNPPPDNSDEVIVTDEDLKDWDIF